MTSFPRPSGTGTRRMVGACPAAPAPLADVQRRRQVRLERLHRPHGPPAQTAASVVVETRKGNLLEPRRLLPEIRTLKPATFYLPGMPRTPKPEAGKRELKTLHSCPSDLGQFVRLFLPFRNPSKAEITYVLGQP